MEFKRLGDIATYINGYAFKPEQWSNNGRPIIRIQNLNNKDAVYNYFDGDINEKYVIRKGDILISWSASIGVYIWDSEEALLNQHIFKVNFDKGEINKIYFKYIVEIALNRATKYMHGSTMKHITKKYFDDILIPIPSLEIQNKIAEVLDKAQELIDKRKEQIKAMDELVKSRFIEIFDDPGRNAMNWEKRTLNDISLRKGEYGSGASAIDYLSGYPRYIRITDINDNGKLNDNKVTVENLSEYEKYKLNDGDILFARTGATVGKTYRYKKSDGECLFAGYLIRFTPNLNIINPDFLFAFTKTSFYKSWVDAKQNTVAQPNINAKQYGEELEVILPPMELQNEFADFVKQVDKIKLKMENNLKELEDNFNSLMQKAFKGELF